MKLIKSLKELNIDEKTFPIFFWDRFLELEKSNSCSVFLCFDEEFSALIPFKVHILKFLKKADYIYVPLNLAGVLLQLDTEKLVIERFHAFLINRKICDVILPPQHYCSFQTYPSKCFYYKIGTLSIDLTMSESDLFNIIDAENRRQIRKSKKLNVDASFGLENLNAYYDTYKSTGFKKGISVEPITYFKKISDSLNENCIVGICRYNSIVLASVFDICDDNAAYSLYSGTANNIMIKGAKKHLIWDELNMLKSRGIKNYHFGGYRLYLNKKHPLFNVQLFKQQMGAKITTGYHFIKIINPVKYYLFIFALKCKSVINCKNNSIINKSGLIIKKTK